MDNDFPWFKVLFGVLISFIVLRWLESSIGFSNLVILLLTVTGGLLIFILVSLIAVSRSLHDRLEEIPSDIDERLENIFKAVGGDTKMREENEIRRKELKKRLIHLLILTGKKTQKEAQEEADKLFEEAEFEESHEDFSLRFESIEKWVKAQEIEERNKNKYGELLPKAREYIKEKKKIEKYDNEMEKALNTDYSGRSWLIKQLVAEKRLEEIKEFNSETEMSEVKYWKVV